MNASLEKLSPLQLGSITFGGAFVIYALVKALMKSRNRVVYPPGPPQDPIIGNIRNFPAKKWYETFCEWQKLYGDLVYIRLPGINLMIVNNLDMAHELLSKRAHINSGRTVGYMLHDLMDWGWALTIRQADKTHQEIRKMFKQGIGPQRIGSHDQLIEDCTKDLIVNFATLQGSPTPMIQNTIGRVVIQIAYGEKIWNSMGQELVRLNVESLDVIDRTFNTLWLVDVFNFLRFIPSWMPGAGFQRWAAHSREDSHKIRTLAWGQILKLHKAGISGHSLGTDLLDEHGPSGNVRDGLAILYFAGVDTTKSAIINFLHTMFVFPEIAQKVHDEIANSIGEGRLPSIGDRAHLPYTEAVWKEGLRWRPGLPIALPHTSSKDQTINGYFIPKGTIINPNIGFMLNDPAIWGDPENFRPERFLKQHNPFADDLPSPFHIMFGFGTRICPGMYLADRLGFHIAATTLYLYEILPLEGKERHRPNTVGYTGNTIRYPADFNVRFVARGQKSQHLLSLLSVENRE